MKKVMNGIQRKTRRHNGPTLKTQQSSAARFIMLGGFLGAGKTSAILRFAAWLANTRGLKAALITNDQANGLVDTALANGAKFEVREIGGGCFCCRSGVLVEAMGKFAETVQPDVVIGEPVGSCTDLVSTVLVPLRSIYKTDYVLAPLSVLVDPFRAARILAAGKAEDGAFSPEVNYIYRKQLEEAEIIVVNKCDVFAEVRLAALCARLGERYPKAEVLRVSARSGVGLVAWWERLLTRTHGATGFMPVDYQVYADGEARLGWVNGAYEVEEKANAQRSTLNAQRRSKKGNGANGGIDGNGLLEMLAGEIGKAFAKRKVEVAHLKISLEESAVAKGQPGRLGVIQWVRSGIAPEFTQRFDGPVRGGRLLLNLRAEAKPAVLSAAVDKALAGIGPEVRVERREYAAFQPSPPKPTHRVTA